jgi:hypothetical protein
MKLQLQYVTENHAKMVQYYCIRAEEAHIFSLPAMMAPHSPHLSTPVRNQAQPYRSESH